MGAAEAKRKLLILVFHEMSLRNSQTVEALPASISLNSIPIVDSALSSYAVMPRDAALPT